MSAVTQIATRQIQAGAINDAQVNSSAAIQTTKLADALNFIMRNGSVAFTGAPNFGGQTGINAGTPVNSTDIPNKAYVDTAVANVQTLFTAKGACRAASTGNVNISSPGATIDGVSLNSGDRVLLMDQSTSSQNGIYIFNGSSSAMTRSTDMSTWAEVVGALITIDDEGTVNGNTIWLVTVAQSGTLGTTSITFLQINTVGLSGSNFVVRETPSGSLNGSNTTFTLANTPTSGSEEVFLNGLLQDQGSGNDYTISGGTITMLTAPLSTDKIRVNYRH